MCDTSETALESARLAQLAMVFDGWIDPAKEDLDWVVKQLATQQLVWGRLFSVDASQLEPLETFDPQWHD